MFIYVTTKTALGKFQFLPQTSESASSQENLILAGWAAG